MKLKGKRFLAILLMLVMVLEILPGITLSTVVYAEEQEGITEGNHDETDEPELSPADETDEDKSDADPENPAEPSENAGDPEQDEAVNEEPQESVEIPQSEEETVGTARIMLGASAPKKNGTDGEMIADSNDTHTHKDAEGNVITFVPWNDSSSLPTEPGSYYLMQDVTLSRSWAVRDGTFNLCLNGKTISSAGAVAAIQMRGPNKNKKLNLFDEAENTGKIINTTTDQKNLAGGVYILNGELNMYGGSLVNSFGYYAGGVYVEKGTFRMYGGEISGNSSRHVGGVYINNSTFSMYGGKITNNTGEIVGGIYSSTNPIPVSGSPIVTGNQANGSDNNVSLYDSSKILIAGPLSGSASMGITMQTIGIFTKSSDGIKPKDYIINFSSDSKDYEVMPLGSDLRIAKPKKNAIDIEKSVPAKVIANNRLYDGTEKPLVTVEGEADGGTMYYALGTDAETAPDTGWDAEIPAAAAEGTYYVWYIASGDDSHEDSAPAGVTVTISRNVYTASADHQEWQKGSSGSLTITFNGKLEDENTYSKWNQKVVIDGAEIPDSAYSHKSGSLVIDLKPAYLETLSAGTHTMDVSFIDGAASVQFCIIEKASSSGSGSSAPEQKNDTVVTCQMAGYPADYAWNEAAKACHPGYIDVNGTFRSTVRASVPNTYDKGVVGNITTLLTSTLIALLSAKMLRRHS